MAVPTPEEICARVYAAMCDPYRANIGDLMCKHDRRRDQGLQFIEQLIYSTRNPDDRAVWQSMGTEQRRAMGHAINVLMRHCRPVDATADAVLTWIKENGEYVWHLSDSYIASRQAAKTEKERRDREDARRGRELRLERERRRGEGCGAGEAGGGAAAVCAAPVKPAVGSLLPKMPLPAHLRREH